ncbi:MAG TPA: heat-inducible transcriptional repressor HrcA [Candidatus Limnocylindria bacterium]|jgi:heat-inducible transcriptional repressor|nr:heat-inducible transcriptional repressor HrcA [Candidatus Limnocylindria bacterium]
MPLRSGQLPQLGDRQRDLLRAVIREYIATAQPVASAALVRRYRLDVSSATVRNELAALEELGLLTHPHTSAGRVPTDLGYRYFIESLMPRPALGAEEQVTVSHQFQQALSDTSDWLRLAASTLARLTTEAAIVTPPATGRTTLRRVEAVPISDRRALLVTVLEGGAVAQQLLELRTATTADHLRALSARLTRELASKDAAAVRAAMEKEQGVDAEIGTAIARVLDEHDGAPSHDIYTDGIQNILAQPEFAAGGRMRDMLQLLQDRTRLVDLLPATLGDDEVHVAIGSDHRAEPLRSCSVIFGRYGAGNDFVGYVGIVGPTRMDYARSIGAVRYVGSLMSDLVRVMEGR